MPANCAGLAPPLYRLEGFQILADQGTLNAALWLAWTDVINAGTWILVVILLEVEVRLQLRGNLSDRIMDGTRYLQVCALLHSVCGGGVLGLRGGFPRFLDAALWLFAFIFIELNVFEWQYETSAEADASARAQADPAR